MSEAGPDAEARASRHAPIARRLHPFSWLFVLLTQLRQFALPLIAVVVVGSGGWELWGAVGALAFAAYSLIYSIGFRYELGEDEIVVREGIFHRTERHVPYERVQNVVHKRNLLHRAFGVVELRLESAGGLKPEAVMSVITRDEARRIEAILRGRGAIAGPAPNADAPFDAASDPASTPLLALPFAEVVRLGLVTNRGLVVVGAAFAFVMQLEPWESKDARRVVVGQVEALIGAGLSHIHGPIGFVASVVALAIAFFVTLKLLSVVMALLAFHDFRLWRDGERISTEGGLLTRHAASARRDKVQRLSFGETWLARRIGRRWLSCEVAASSAMNEGEGARLRWLAPIATPARIAELVETLAPGLSIDALPWRPLHPRAWRRHFGASAYWLTLLLGPGVFLFGAKAVLAWGAVLLFLVLESRGWARFAAYARVDDVIAYRAGWWTHRWTVARIEKGQSIKLSQSPFDRRHGTATVMLDTAGANALGLKLAIPYLDETEARALAGELRARL